MAVWALANMKGGVGKTTSALMLARAAVQAGQRVLMLDLDLNGQLSRLLGHWPEGAGVFSEAPVPVEVSDNLSLLPAPGPDFPLDGPPVDGDSWLSVIQPLMDGFDLIIMDTPSGYFPLLDAVMSLSDVWIVPTTLMAPVRQASAHYLLRMARQAVTRGYHFKVRLLPVMFNAHLGSHRIGLEALKRFVGADRVLPPVRQDGRLLAGGAQARATPAVRDYRCVFDQLDIL